MKSLMATHEIAMMKMKEIYHNFPWEDKDAYLQWCSQTYYFANATTRLLCLAAANIGYERQPLHQRFVEHAQEEKNHELLLVRDIKFLGSDISKHEERPATAAFYQSQYYWLEHEDPMSFFGYILLLEAVGARFCHEACVRATEAFGAKATTFLKVHSAEDVDHVEKAFKELEGISPALEQRVVANYKMSLGLYETILVEAMKHAKGVNTAKTRQLKGA